MIGLIPAVPARRARGLRVGLPDLPSNADAVPRVCHEGLLGQRLCRPSPPVELTEGSSPLAFIVEHIEGVKGFCDSPEFGDGLGQPCRTIPYLQRSHDAGRRTRPSCREPASRSMSSQCGVMLRKESRWREMSFRSP